ncbi:MAG: DUF4105 domain-containing protein [Haliscomenobacteraceae bacterium CHB4]|nr:hypothetical protein [Saprospiraceae bacterium]MCE7925095.1 DUF4105 domain-containing protein [Haliscomenobacteraceae bacterium CHB4]
MKRLIFLAFALVAGKSFSQPPVTLSDSAHVSLMTVAPGEMLYSTFGHSAIRFFDPAHYLDRCYNYGTFDFEQPNFILKFCRGKLLYFLDIEPCKGFVRGNLLDQRAMKEQMLNLSREQKQLLFNILQENAREENRYYKYDFFYDNCATRIRDVVEKAFDRPIAWDSSRLALGTTMRQLLNPYMAHLPWTHFGMNLGLGYAADRRALAEDFMFLPDYVHDMFATARINDSTLLVKSERHIPEYSFPTPEFKPGFFGRPLWVMSLVALIGLASMFNRRTERIFDAVFWFVLGIAGLLIAFLWFATDHTSTKTNFNLLWALPTHVLVFWRSHKGGWIRQYFLVAGALALLTLVCWKIIPQEMPVEAMPLVVLVAAKGLWKYFDKKIQV